MGWRLGYEIGGTNTKAVVVNTDTDFTIEDKAIAFEETIVGAGRVGEFLEQLNRVGDEALEKAGIKAQDLEGIAIASPGPLDIDKGLLMEPTNFKGMGVFDVCTPLKEHYGLENVNLGNDVSTAILGEQYYGFGKGKEEPSFMLITVGTGVGGGHVDRGRLKKGFRGNADEIGHIQVEYDEEKARPDGCTRKNPKAVGHLEAYCSMLNFQLWVRDGIYKKGADKSEIVKCAALRLSISRANAYERFEAQDVFEAYMNGDRQAADYVNGWREYFIRALATYVAINDPEVIFLMGAGPLNNEDILLHNLQPDGSKEEHWMGGQVSQRLHTKDYFKPENLRLTTLGDKVGLYGSIALAAPKKLQ